MSLSEINGISIAEIVVYTPTLFIAILLATRHGFGRAAGWLFLILFSLIRIIGSALELGTISQPTNVGLYIGYFVLQNIGLSPLILISLGLLQRVVINIQSSRTLIVNPQTLRLTSVVIIVGLILSAVGGSQLSGIFAKSASGNRVAYTTPTLSVAGLALMIAGYGLVIIAMLQLFLQISALPNHERRVLYTVAACVPFLVVRIVFSAMGTFAQNCNFTAYNACPAYDNYLLGMSVLMEMIVVILVEAVGLTLHKLPKPVKGEHNGNGPMNGDVPMGSYANDNGAPNGQYAANGARY